MKSKTILIILALLIVAGGGVYFYTKNLKQAKAPEINSSSIYVTPTPVVTPTPTPSPTVAPKVNLPNKQLQGTFSSGDDAEMGVDILVKEVDFDGSKFSPLSQDVKVNDVIIFKNTSAAAIKILADDASYTQFKSGSIAPGRSFKFQFTRAGNWKFHIDGKANASGQINVAK